MNRKEFLLIAITTLITVIAWVVFDIIHARNSVQIDADLQKTIEPIDTNFDIGVINE